MGLPSKESNLWVRNVKIEWLIPTSLSLLFLLISLLRDSTKTATVDRNHHMRVGCGPNAPKDRFHRCSQIFLFWLGVVILFTECLVCAWQGCRCWGTSSEWQEHSPSSVELVFHHCGRFEKYKDVPGLEEIPDSRRLVRIGSCALSLCSIREGVCCWPEHWKPVCLVVWKVHQTSSPSLRAFTPESPVAHPSWQWQAVIQWLVNSRSIYLHKMMKEPFALCPIAGLLILVCYQCLCRSLLLWKMVELG